MSYYNSKSLSKARGDAVKLVVIDKYPIQVVARRYGVNRTTIWRWYKRWLEINSNEKLYNANRQQTKDPRQPGYRLKDLNISSFRLDSCSWIIPSKASIPLHPHCLSDDLVQLVLDVRNQLKRCAEVVWHYINHILEIKISLSSVRRILKLHGYIRKVRKKLRSFKGIRRSDVLLPGGLVETDTIHLYNPVTGRKRYIYTVIDLYTRMSYAEVHDKISPGTALNAVLNAQRYFGFKFRMVQSDNGAEFSSYFENGLIRAQINVRHTRLRRPNDNAHIERFNRTIQEECTGRYTLDSVSLESLNKKVARYIDFYNRDRIHSGIEYRTPMEMLHRL